MKAQITDRDALRAVSPLMMTAYARAAGWIPVGRYRQHSEIYEHVDAPELIIPGTERLLDYADAVAAFVQVIAIAEARDELEVYRDLVSSDRDLVRLRAPYAGSDGSVFIDAGVMLFEQARNLLTAAACAATGPRRTYRAGSVKEAQDYMSRVRLGQTEQGSYVVTLLIPIPPAMRLEQSGLWPEHDEEPFERRVTKTLAKSLDAARVAAESVALGGASGGFERAVDAGVSANLCDALADLIDSGEGLDVSFSWAKTRPRPETRKVISFERSEAPIFRAAASDFRSKEPRGEETLMGWVNKLARKPQADAGAISLSTFIEGKPVSVSVPLPTSTYHEALQAHDDEKPISIRGNLVRHGQRWLLEGARDLIVIIDAD